MSIRPGSSVARLSRFPAPSRPMSSRRARRPGARSSRSVRGKRRSRLDRLRQQHVRRGIVGVEAGTTLRQRFGQHVQRLVLVGQREQPIPQLFDRAARLVGLGGSETPVEAPVPKAKPAPKTQTASAGAIRPKGQPSSRQKQRTPAQRSRKYGRRRVRCRRNDPGLISGAQPTVPSGGFETRFGAWQR